MEQQSQILVAIILLPLLLQIVLPLVMLAGYGVVAGVSSLFGGDELAEDVSRIADSDEKLQLSRA